jgi:hypothetical protein
MIRIKETVEGRAVTCEMELAGDTFEIDLMPISQEDRASVFKLLRKHKQLVNPVTKAMELVPYFDDQDPAIQKAFDDLLDRVIVNFRGIGDSDGNPLDGTIRANKILLGSIKVKDVEDIAVTDESGAVTTFKQPRERYFKSLIIDKAIEVGSAFAESDSKN